MFFTASLFSLEMQLVDRSLFKGKVAELVVYLEAEKEPILVSPESMSDFTIIDRMFFPLNEDKRGSYAAYISVVPKRAGLLKTAALKFNVDGNMVTVPGKQVRVSQPYRTDKMAVRINPDKNRVYVGEPVHVEVIWECLYEVNALRGFDWNPSFFHQDHVKIVVPRVVELDNELSIGLPIGGQRIIAQRRTEIGEAMPTQNSIVGQASFSLYLQFEREGIHKIEESVLSCVHLFETKHQIGNYAAYFNNSLFTQPERDDYYEKVYTRSNSFDIEVLALPEDGKRESYSGLVAPVDFDLKVLPQSVEVGGLMNLFIRVKADTCSELIRLPDLKKQRGLKYAFHIAEEFSEKWMINGREFKYTLRPLRADIQQFPSLEFQVLDSVSGAFKMIQSNPIDMEVLPNDGERYFDIKSLDALKSTVESNDKGIWFNYAINTWDQIFSFMVEMLNRWFWILALWGPLCFLACYPFVRESYLRAKDPIYARRRLAYESFLDLVRRDDLSHRVLGQGLRKYLSGLFARNANGFTVGDAHRLLRDKGFDDDICREVGSILSDADREVYAKEAVVRPSNTREIGKIKGLASALYEGIQVLLICLLGMGLLQSRAEAQSTDESWQKAERYFALGLEEMEKSSFRAEEYFATAALAYEEFAQASYISSKAWYNAGNAWFKAKEPGRALASYLRAQRYRPFDQKLKDNIQMIRSLNEDSFQASSKEIFGKWLMGWHRSPQEWRKVVLLLCWTCLWLLALIWLRYRSRIFQASLICLVLVSITLGASLLWTSWNHEQSGVIIVDEVYARKGPSYAYQSAYYAPLHQALEIKVKQLKGDWVMAELSDGSVGWLPAKSVAVF